MTDARTASGLQFVIISEEDTTRASVKRHLNERGHRVVGESEDLYTGLRLVRSVRPEFVVLSLDPDPKSALDVVKTIHDERPATGLIVLAQQSAPDLIIESVRAGAQEFLPLPLNFETLDVAVERIRRTVAAVESGPPRRGRVFAVCAAKGGVGGSSIAANVALSLAAEPGTQVALVDFNGQMGDLGLMLDVDAPRAFSQLVEESELDAQSLALALADHRSGVKILNVFDGVEADPVLEEHIPALFGLLHKMFDYVVVDVGRHLDERTAALLDLSDEILLVSALDVPTSRNTRRYLDLFEQLEIPDERVRLIVNRAQEGGRISGEDFERTIGAPIYWSIPNDFRPNRDAIDAGNPVVLDSPGTKLAREYRGLAGALREASAQVAANVSEPQTPRDDVIRDRLQSSDKNPQDWNQKKSSPGAPELSEPIPISKARKRSKRGAPPNN